VARVGLLACGRAVTLLGCLAQHAARAQLDRRLQHALFGSALVEELFGGSLPHPARLVDYAGYRLEQLWPGQPVFEPAALTELHLLDGLQQLVLTLLDYEMPLRALPLLCLYRHLAADTCRDVHHTVTADALAVQALCELGQLHEALQLLGAAHVGSDLPLDWLELPPSRLPEGTAAPPPPPPPPPPLLLHLPPEDEANAAAVEALLALDVAPHLPPLYGASLLRLLELARVQLLLRLAERPPPKPSAGDAGAPAAAAAAPAKGGKGAPPPAKGGGAPAGGGGGDGESGQAATLLAKAEELLEALGAAVAAELEPAGEGAEPPRGAAREALVALACRGALLRAALHTRRGLHTAAVGAAAGGIALAQSVPPPEGAAGAAPPCVQVGALLWLRLRLSLVRSALCQRQLAAADEQIKLGRMEAHLANDARVDAWLQHARLLLLAERGELEQATAGFEGWLEHAAAEADNTVPTAVGSVHYATLLLAQLPRRAARGEAEVAEAAALCVEALQRAERLLTQEAHAQGMLSTEAWACLVDAPAGPAVPPSLLGTPELHALRNLHLRPLQPLLAARLGLAVALQLAYPTDAAADMAAEMAQEQLQAAVELLPHVLHPRPAVVARIHLELGRLQRRRLSRNFYSPTRAALEWGGAAGVAAAKAVLAADAEAAAAAEGGENAAGDAAEAGAEGGFGAARASLEAALRVGDSGPLDPELRSAALLELALLHGAQLQEGREAHHLGCAAAYLRLAAAAAAARRNLFAGLPGLPAAPLDAPAPAPLALLVGESRALAAARPLASEEEAAAPDSRALLSLLPALMRQRALPRFDEDGAERLLQMLGATLAAGAKPFGEVLAPPTPPAAELDLGPAAEAGALCGAWHGDAMRAVGSPQLTLLFALAAPTEEEADRFVVGERTLPRAAVLAVRATLAAALHNQGGPTLMPRHPADAPPPTPREQFDGCLRAVRALLQPDGAAAAAPPPPAEGDAAGEGEGEGEGGAAARAPEAEADAAVPEESLPLLHQLFDPLQGAAAADSALCSWLLALLHPS